MSDDSRRLDVAVIGHILPPWHRGRGGKGVATAAVQMLGGEAMMRQSRKPQIMADAAHAILSKPSREFTGNFCIDDLVLHAAGVRDFSVYAAVPGATQFLPDFFVPQNTPALPA